MKHRDRTSMGGPGGAFRSTQWTEILQVDTGHELRRKEALQGLIGRYWKPVYCYLRRKGCDNEKAKDLTQGFFQEVVLERGLVQKADRAKGRFRTFLLTALDRYATDVHRTQTAQKRGGLVRLDGLDSPNIPEPAVSASPEEAFQHAWASALMDQVIAEVSEDCRKSGMAVHWDVFSAKVLEPIREGAEPPSHAELCSRYGIGDERKTRNMVTTVKRRLQAALKRHVRPFVDSDDQVDSEIDELIRILSNPGAAP